MDFSFDDEQVALRQAVRDFVARDGGWATGAGQLGLPGLAVPEDYGGAGAGWVELAIALEELGRALLPLPLLSSALAAAAVLAGGDDAAGAALLPSLADGSRLGALAAAERGSWDPSRTLCRASARGAGWLLSGRKEHVLDGADADLLVVVARTADGVGLFAVAADAPGVRRVAQATLDQTRAQATVELSEAPGRPLGGGRAAVDRVLDLACVALAVEAVGGARRCLELTVGHLQTREQFGRPLGSFQALKHRVADLAVAVEAATSTAYYAAWAASAAPAELPLVAPLAKSYCSEVFLQVAAETIQLHGGIGFTWEHDAHRYFTRAKSSEQLVGSPVGLRRLLGERAGLAVLSASAAGGW